jgi:hypothetical protein
MAITLKLGAVTLALPDGMVWEDEGEWDALLQDTLWVPGTGGTLKAVTRETTRQGGRPVTLAGGLSWAWVTRAQVDAIRALGTAGAVLTLTLHDARTLSVTPRRDGPGGAWVEATPLPLVLDSGPADPVSTTRYSLDRVRLMEVAT